MTQRPPTRRPSAAARAVARIVLVRHAEAGDRGAWAGADHVRPLTPLGAWQAERLGETLAQLEPTAVFSSSATRCRETVAPLSRRTGLAVVELRELAEGSDPSVAARVLGFRRRESGGTVVACSHGDVIPGLIDVLGGVALFGALPVVKKASVTVVTLEGDVPVGAYYLPPPAVARA